MCSRRWGWVRAVGSKAGGVWRELEDIGSVEVVSVAASIYTFAEDLSTPLLEFKFIGFDLAEGNALMFQGKQCCFRWKQPDAPRPTIYLYCGASLLGHGVLQVL